MSCPNNNCDSSCTCNQCCPPVLPPIPPTPPSCIGTECDEIYNAACVTYTGNTIDCLNIPNGSSLNNIIQVLAQKLCDCDTGRCLSPLELFFNRIASINNNAKVYNENSNVKDILNTIFEKGGLVFKKCKYCCPNSSFYALSLNASNRDEIYELCNNGLGYPIQVPLLNSELNYISCATTFLTLFDDTLGNNVSALTPSTIYEFGGFNGNSGLCELNKILPSLFTTEEITSLMYKINERDLFVACDTVNGNIFIGSRTNYKDYLCQLENNCK